MRQLTIAFLVIAIALGINAQTSGDKQASGGQSNQQSQEAQETESWEARSIVGYHQAGAAAADFAQNFFMDFFISRALHSQELWQGRLSMWGDVRIASAPQQISTAVATFVTDFGNQVGKLPVNQLALSADFQSGVEGRLKTWARPGAAKRTLGLVAFFGALGLFESPSKNVTIYEVPAAGSFQRDRFVAQFGEKVASYPYVGFVPPDRERFYRQYGLGLRVTTYSKGASPPGMYTFSVGQDEVITGGIFRSVVGRFDVFYPLPVNGKVFKSIYLFGTTNLRLSKAKNIDAFVLNNPNIDPATGKRWVDASGNPLPPKVQAYDPSVALVTVRSTRDTYRIGVGVDLISLIQSIPKPKSPQAPTNPPAATNPGVTASASQK